MRPPHRILPLLLLWVMGCSAASSPEKLRIGLLEAAEGVAPAGESLRTYFEAHLDLPVEILYRSTYVELLDLLARDGLDLVRLGGVAFLVAQARHGAEPLALRQVDETFQSVILVPVDIAACDLDDLRDTDFAFTRQLSMSGHVMPRFHLEELGMIPESFFASVRYSGNQEQARDDLVRGEVDAISVSSFSAERWARGGLLDTTRVRTLWTSPPFTNVLWAVRPHLDPEFKSGLLEAFLSLSPAKEEEEELLRLLSARAYVPATSHSLVWARALLDRLEPFLTSGGPQP